MFTQSVYAPHAVEVANHGRRLTRSRIVQRAALLFVALLLTACSASAAPRGDLPSYPSTGTEQTDQRVEGNDGSDGSVTVEGDDGGYGSGTVEGEAGGDDSGAAVAGLVTTPDGQPVPGIVVEFKSMPDNCTWGCSQPHTTSDTDGRYRMELASGTYNAMCLVDHDGYECGVRGSQTGGHPISVPPASQRIDFIVCEIDQYPECLMS